MKKSFILFAASLLALAGCSRNQEIDIPDANLSLFARTESPADTKTVVESGVHVLWEPGDEIAVFLGDKSAKFTTDITAASGTATFKGTFGDSSWPEDLDLWAVYPFSEDATFDGETITTTLPSEQVAREGSFGKDMNLSVAHSNTSTLQFYNVGGGLRFSVTEEGIKKVMFEGLSGEIISGKVKIGFEDGVPKVLEVSGGSQFITLLPPAGQDTFQTNTWYYIVAIPGSLEGGFKLRFYKDDDYARKVSEKAVEIKRSIYGNLEKADQGIEYESTTTSFPETEDEWEETESNVNTVKASIESILNHAILAEGEHPDPISFASEVAMIEGVLSTSPSQDGCLLYLQMQNGVYVNVILDNMEDSFGGSFSYSGDILEQRISQNSNAVSNVPSGNKALVLLPLYDEVISDLGEHARVLYANIISSLKSCGFVVDPYYNSQASVNKFRGDNLELYDVVYLNTHGTNEAKLADGTLTTALKTGSPISSNSDNTGIRWGSIPKRSLWIDPGNEDCYWITTESYKFDRPSFNSSWIFLHACKSLTRNDLSQYFLDRGAAACSGFLTNASKRSSVDFAADMIDAFASGMEVQAASQWAITHSTNQFGELWTQGGTRDNFCTYRNTELGSFYLFDPKPYDLKYNPENKECVWKVHPHTGEYVFELYVNINGNNTYISTIVDDGRTDYTYDISFLAPGSYSWYIEMIHQYSNDVIESYYSDVVHFSVEDTPSPEELLVTRTYNGKTYSIIRKNVSSTDCRINGDGSKFYSCSYSVKMGNDTYDLPGTFYSYTDRDFRDTGPVMAVNTQTGKTYVFLIEKDTDETYGMCGHVFTLSSGSISQQTVFTYANFGWFPYFEWNNDQFLLNMFSYAQYFSIIAPQDEDWTLYYNEDIYPDDFHALQQQHDLICIH